MDSPAAISSSDSTYIADKALATAARVALELGQPLLLTGEPGTGKTTFAKYLASTLVPEWKGSATALPLYKFETKSTSAATDLFYRFDHLRRLHAVHNDNMSRDNRDYITFEALGNAILMTRPRSDIDDLLPRTDDHLGAPLRSVVLIDEIDKAPRDFPNDILNEIEQMFFRIPELRDPSGRGGRVVEADSTLKPIVVLTSNSEKNLPAAFLRRCIFHHIEFPKRADSDKIAAIVAANLTGCPAGRLTDDAIDFFYTLREDRSMEKPPATAELVQWVKELHRRAVSKKWMPTHDLPLTYLDREELLGTLGTLAKSVDDLRKAREHIARRY